MARKEVNIGTTGNDATGDSIRTGFDKVNQNFTELYAALGLGGGLNFETLDNTPNSLTSNKVIATNANGDAIIEKVIEGDGLTIDNSSDPNKTLFYVTNPFNGKPATFGNGTQITLLADSKEAVEKFYEIAMSKGATDEGGPGVRSDGNYYAYIRDFDGNKIAAKSNLK